MVNHVREQARNGLVAPDESDGTERIHPLVQRWVAASNGILYVPLVGKLTRYPIPDIRLPRGGGASLLDIGASWGRWSISAALKGYTVTSLDPDIYALRAAKKVARQHGVEIDPVCADARFLPFSDDSFDCVFSYSVLQHLPKADVLTTLSEVRRVLKPGGYCLIQMPNKIGIRSLQHQFRRHFRQARGFEVRYWSPRELRASFTDAIGTSDLLVDCFFGLGLQPSDIDIMPSKYRAVIRMSEALRHISERLPALGRLADSLYVRAKKPIG